jgi:hypothetical protein
MAQNNPKAAQNATRHRSSSSPIVRIRPPNPPPILPTASDERRYCGIRHVDRYEYFDTVKYLSKSEISDADQAWLRSHCKYLDIRAHGHWVRPKRGQPYKLNIWPWRFRIEIHVPDLAALDFFAKLPDTEVRAVHIARDFTFDDETGKSAMLDLFSERYVQRWQRKRQRISFDNGGLSTGRRGKGQYFTCYISKPCRIDGIVDCFHGEGRHHGTKALAQIGIHSPADLLDFHFSQYHSAKDQECLREIDKRRLGQYIRNRADHTRDQHAHPSDLRIGGLLWRIHAMDQFGNSSVQQFIRSYPAIRSAKNIIRTVDTEVARP